jgi:disulfide bond formation protein DsbB
MLSPGPISANAQALPAGSRALSLVWLAVVILLLSAATILGALGFEHLGKYQPCALCLMQRTPYYVGVPVVAAALLAVWTGMPRLVVAILFSVFALLMLYGGGLAVYHSGVEWKIFDGPAFCAPSVGVTSAADVLAQLEEHPPSCTDAPWRMFGLSFAGWNVLVSALLLVLSAIAAKLAWRPAIEGKSTTREA